MIMVIAKKELKGPKNAYGNNKHRLLLPLIYYIVWVDADAMNGIHHLRIAMLVQLVEMVPCSENRMNVASEIYFLC